MKILRRKLPAKTNLTSASSLLKEVSDISRPHLKPFDNHEKVEPKPDLVKRCKKISCLYLTENRKEIVLYFQFCPCSRLCPSKMKLAHQQLLEPTGRAIHQTNVLNSEDFHQELVQVDLESALYVK